MHQATLNMVDNGFDVLLDLVCKYSIESFLSIFIGDNDLFFSFGWVFCGFGIRVNSDFIKKLRNVTLFLLCEIIGVLLRCDVILA